MKTKNKWLVLAGVIALIGLFAAFGLNRSNQAQHFTAKVEKGEIHDVVEATGTINAVITVQVGSQVSGTVAKLNVDFNSRVRKGDVVALIDPALFQGALLQTAADLENAKANLTAAKANLEKAKAAAVQAKADYGRTVALNKEGVLSQAQLDLAKANIDSANAGVTGAAASVTQAEAQVSQKTAAVTVSQTNLNYTVIRSPIDGTVVARNVDVGQTVAASLQAPTIFTIAQDLTKMLVYAKTDESDVGNIKLGKAVTFKVDAFPRDTFHGRVAQVRMNATTVQNVVKLPNTGLRYKPPMTTEEVLAIYKQYGIEVDQKQSATADAAAERSVAQGGGTGNLPRKPKADSAVVWKLHPDNTMEPVKVSLGITDHAYTEVALVLKGELKEGDDVIIRSVAPKSQVLGGIRR